ncbi:GNAT family N-acetyltransferase [Bordetella sp. FB-8]|uniref:GNAT family N-acetyltransferase n=1 Tax=Bordetella sp. FB-8 TaxID=1159870 RepID=UPI0003795310|nr:GNAT family N-acetyltransferase [Bordetella sp. FB-8]
MDKGFIVRSVRQADFPLWKLLWDGYNAFYGRAGVTALDPEITATTWRRFFDGYEPMYGLVAESEEGGLLGLTHYLLHRSTTQIGPNCYLQDLFTAEAARGKGVGRALIEAVYQRAAQADAGRVYWQTQTHNATARRLYDAVAEDSGFMVYRKLMP